jgi:hypothetical protein
MQKELEETRAKYIKLMEFYKMIVDMQTKIENLNNEAIKYQQIIYSGYN